VAETAVASAPVSQPAVAAAAGTVAEAGPSAREDTAMAGAPIPAENPLRETASAPESAPRGRLGRLLGMFGN
jgi:hypothetical protein